MAKPAPAPYTMSDSDYQAQDDCSTLMRADEITKNPARTKAARRHATKKLSQYRRIAKANR